MDIAELWQEHKRWILGCAVGLLVYLIGGMVIQGIYSTDAVTSQILRQRRGFQPGEMYTSQALTLARGEQSSLAEELTRLRGALEFNPEPRFLLEGRAEPDDLHFSQVQSDLRKELLDRANNLNVDLSQTNLVWPRAVGEEIGPVLLGLALMDQAVNRLLDAHERVVEPDPEALGLQLIEFFRVESIPGNRRGARYRRPSQGFDPEASLGEELVSFAFRADTATTMLFLESCRDPSNPIALVELSLHRGQLGEPLLVKGKLAAITFKSLD
jgi:hypothetical protein